MNNLRGGVRKYSVLLWNISPGQSKLPGATVGSAVGRRHLSEGSLARALVDEVPHEEYDTYDEERDCQTDQDG